MRKIDEYHDQGVQDGEEFDYYPTCFLMQVVGSEVKKQESEIDEVQLFSLNDVPASLAFEHAQMIKDFVTWQKKNEE